MQVQSLVSKSEQLKDKWKYLDSLGELQRNEKRAKTENPVIKTIVHLLGKN